MTERVLRAYYDFAVVPVSYSVFDFLYLAEIERIHRKLDALEFIVVANTGDGFRSDSSIWPIEEKRFRLTNIVLRAGNLLPSCRRTVYHPTREDAAADFKPDAYMFPNGYSVQDPVTEYEDIGVFLALYQGKRLGTFRAPSESVQRVEAWLAANAGERKPVVITIRNYPHEPLRNSNIPEWIRFAKSLDPNVFCPVFVRDTNDIFGKPDAELGEFLQFDPASIDIDLRLSLYEKAYINLFADTGPTLLCMLDNVTRSIRFKVVPDVYPSGSVDHFLRRGYEPGMEWVSSNSFQRTVWKQDDFPVIKREFEKLVAMIESGAPPSPAPLPPLVKTLSRVVIGQNFGMAEKLAEIGLESDPEDPEIRFLLARTYEATERYEEAAKLYEDILRIPNSDKAAAIPYANCLAATGRVSDAVEFLLSVEQRNTDINVHFLVGTKLSDLGEEEHAVRILETLLKKHPNDPKVLGALASCYSHENTTIPNALPYLANSIRNAPDDPEYYTAMAHCYSRIGRYNEAIQLMAQRAKVTGDFSTLDWVALGLWRDLAGDSDGAKKALSVALTKIDATMARQSRREDIISRLIALRARIHYHLGNMEAAQADLQRTNTGRPVGELEYDPQFYLKDTPQRLNRLRDIVGNRDVFIFCHGPSIAAMQDFWKSFSASEPCLFGLNRFRVFETGFLKQTGHQIDVGVAAHHRLLQPHMDNYLEFLSRDRPEMFITSRWALDRVSSRFPSRNEIEKKYDEKLLYFGRTNLYFTHAPDSPLRFLFANTLSIMTSFAMIAGARRVFIFGADGKADANSEKSTHYGADSGDLRFDLVGQKRKAVVDAFASDTQRFNQSTDFELMATEQLFDVKRPEIFNVSTESAITLFPKIDYETALSMMEPETVDRRQSA